MKGAWFYLELCQITQRFVVFSQSAIDSSKKDRRYIFALPPALQLPQKPKGSLFVPSFAVSPSQESDAEGRALG